MVLESGERAAYGLQPEMPSSAHWWTPRPPSALRAPQCLHGKEPSPATVLGSARARTSLDPTLGLRTAWD